MQEIKCQNCRISKLCLPVMLADSEIEHLDSIVQRGKPLNTDENLFRSGDKFENIYAVRSGSLKSYTISEDGIEQVTGFYLPGEIIGLDAISSQVHPSYAKALETSMICALPFESLESLATGIPSLQRQLLNVMSNEIRDDQELMLLLNKKTSEERMAAFLVNLSIRFGQRGLSSRVFRLTMSRRDIGNYLGLAVETVSRVLTKLQKQEYILVDDKEITFTNPEKLSELAGVMCYS
ncbi:fumarate/nitrate reduction transcriptional regulator Fnr [Pleionea sp. CnH1-48]|uniref:fumarate/nitrate reduction transcriptional regulator Fnr n=1 Tax=Pleionea sp. CnH1-48 TaxID=2954494 RepID=UPI0020974426|nr:fumarate/nitrate reduction transcriptional regulator Fnr [Pleionea sp. CnH1-48]MCO7223948.1 fumarate/nitrate reduction transcriptional regulator Fnr [Pleionea sp. CnH1-48]